MSQMGSPTRSPSCGRLTPRSSAVGQLVPLPASIAGLLGCSAYMKAKPAAVLKGVSWGDTPMGLLDVPLPKVQPAAFWIRLCIAGARVPAQSGEVEALFPPTMVLLSRVVPPAPMPPPPVVAALAVMVTLYRSR